jgi:DNA-binding transcriptional LysR family regulator
VKRSSDDGAVFREWTGRGCRHRLQVWLDVPNDVQAGRLVILLEEWHSEPAPLNLVYAYREFQPPLLRRLIDFVAARSACCPSTT